LYIALAKYLKNIKILYSLIGVFAITVFIEGYSTIPALTMILQFIDNIIGGLLSGYVMTLMTKITDQEYLGKVNGITSTLMYFGLMVSFILSGVIVKYSSIVVAFSVASLTFVVCFIMLYIESKRGLLDEVNN
ncbi:MFS transporter, partial [Terrisporobacter sp.]|uniref:MFS transporter n=1 Tax=Terrisporobacter sp. TaxID=1965305 RepID=UPI002618F9B4